MDSARVLLTGASGMLGKVLAKRLVSSYEVVGVSKSGRAGTTACDLGDRTQVRDLFKAGRYALVIHAAAYSDVDGCEKDPGMAHASNALSTKNLAEECAAFKTPFIYVSTDYVFDGRKSAAYIETDKTFPVNIYGLTKLEGEFYAKNIPAVSAIVRTSWLFGPDNPNNFVNAVITRLKVQKIARVLDDQEDCPTYVADLSDALQKIGEYMISLVKKTPDAAWHEVFHVCNRGGTTRYALTLKIKELLGWSDTKVEKLEDSQIPNRIAVRPAYAVMSARHYEEFFKTNLRPWEESLKEYLNGAVLCGSL